MRKMISTLIICFTMQGCESQSNANYITSCVEPACSMKASLVERNVEPREGVTVIVSPSLKFTVENTISKVAQQGNILALFSSDGWKVGATSLSAFDVGLDDAAHSMEVFMDWVFLKDFSSLKEADSNESMLHAVRSFKLSSFSGKEPRYFERGNIKVFYYLSGEQKYKIYIVYEGSGDAVTMLDLYGFSTERFEQLVSTLNSY